jgi:hypothetical protein
MSRTSLYLNIALKLVKKAASCDNDAAFFYARSAVVE